MILFNRGTTDSKKTLENQTRGTDLLPHNSKSILWLLKKGSAISKLGLRIYKSQFCLENIFVQFTQHLSESTHSCIFQGIVWTHNYFIMKKGNWRQYKRYGCASHKCMDFVTIQTWKNLISSPSSAKCFLWALLTIYNQHTHAPLLMSNLQLRTQHTSFVFLNTSGFNAQIKGSFFFLVLKQQTQTGKN